MHKHKKKDWSIVLKKKVPILTSRENRMLHSYSRRLKYDDALSPYVYMFLMYIFSERVFRNDSNGRLGKGTAARVRDVRPVI